MSLKNLCICFLVFFTACNGSYSGNNKIGRSSFLIDDGADDSIGRRVKRKIIYDLGCLRDSTISDAIIGIGSQIEDKMIEASKVQFSINEEMAAGDTVLSQMRSKYHFLNSGNNYARIQRVSNRLISAIDSPVGFKYQLYLIQSDEVNAFTAGGKIYVFTGILDQIESDDELASVLGHEIYHNELGHINKKLKRQVVLSQLMKSKRGKYAGLAMLIFGSSFNQDEETLCDLHGADLAFAAGYNACSAINFWNRISANEQLNNYSKWLRSHPFGKQRINCIRHHISVNYGDNCSNE